MPSGKRGKVGVLRKGLINQFSNYFERFRRHPVLLVSTTYLMRRPFSPAQPLGRRFYRIPRQWWSDSPVDRSLGSVALASDDPDDADGPHKRFLRDATREPSARFLFFAEDGKVAVDTPTGAAAEAPGARPTLAWRDYATLEKLGLGALETGDGEDTLLLLGRRREDGLHAGVGPTPGADGGWDPVLLDDGWRFAVDASRVPAEELCVALGAHGPAPVGEEGEKDGGGVGGPTTAPTTCSAATAAAAATTTTALMAPRALMGKLDRGGLAILGQAASRLAWHREVTHCVRSGRRLVPAGGGHRRRDPEEPNSRKAVSYPRTDPVAIMLVQSPDGSKCLLGRTKRHRNSNM